MFQRVDRDSVLDARDQSCSEDFRGRGKMGGKAHFVEQDAGLTVPAVELAEVEGDVEAEEAFDARDTTETLEKLHNGHDLVRSQDEQESDSDCWEVESIFADALEGMGDQQLYEGGQWMETSLSQAMTDDGRVD